MLDPALMFTRRGASGGVCAECERGFVWYSTPEFQPALTTARPRSACCPYDGTHLRVILVKKSPHFPTVCETLDGAQVANWSIDIATGEIKPSTFPLVDVNRAEQSWRLPRVILDRRDTLARAGLL